MIGIICDKNDKCEKKKSLPNLSSSVPFNAPEAMTDAKSGLTLLKIQSARFVWFGPKLARYDAFSLVNTGFLKRKNFIELRHNQHEKKNLC